jgi:hypothetical protein
MITVSNQEAGSEKDQDRRPGAHIASSSARGAPERFWGAPDLPDCGSFRIFTRKDGIKCQGNTGNLLQSSVKRQRVWSWKLPGRSRMSPAS